MIDKRALKSAVEDLADAARRLEAMSAILDGCIRKRAQEGDEPPAEPPVEPPAEEGGGDFKDEGTTGEEGGGEGEGAEGDLGDLDLGGPGGGFGGGGGGGGGFGGPPSGGLGADTAVEDTGGDAGDAGMKKDMAGLRSEIEGVKRTLVNVVEVLDHVRDPLRDPLRGNDAMQSV